MAILHVTNGDSVAEGLRQAQLGEVLPWRDVLHDGPVHATGSDIAFHRMRSAFLASRNAGRIDEIERSFALRDSRLDAAGAEDEVILWFEPDLYDQLQLCEVLARLARRPANARPRISIVPADVLLGPMDSAVYAPWVSQRRDVGERDLRLAVDFWIAFTGPDPSFLMPFADSMATLNARSYASDPQVVLPHLGAAIVRWLEELPSEFNGLTRSEQQFCRAVRNGARTMGRAYRRSHHDVEQWIWLGDWSFAWYVERLSNCIEPAVTYANGNRITPRSLDPHLPTFESLEITLTDFGRAVESGNADFINVNGIDRWFGGAHLGLDQHWRWNHVARQIISRPSAMIPPPGE